MRIVGMVLAPGASANSTHEGLLAIERALRDVVAERIDFPYIKAKKRVPDKAEILIETVVQETHRLAEKLGVSTDQIAVGGRSMGGRMASMAVAQGLNAAALVLISYPLHPPGKPEKQRVEHFPRIPVPCLFVSGTRDAFSTPEELLQATRLIKTAPKIVLLEKGNHGLAGLHDQAAAEVTSFITSLNKDCS
ncbi:MAG: dienelactone hydrolase family protein [Firmicutes bacterium]|nr:dienelactone hydrolase family protein [Bacillota bacterium]